MPVLTKERRKNLLAFKRHLKSAIKDLIKGAKTDRERKYYEGLMKSIDRTGIYFYNTEALAEKGWSRLMGKREVGFSFQYIKKGNLVKILRAEEKGVISIGGKHVFKGNKVTASGISTLIHEWSHYAKDITPIAKATGLPKHLAEEFMSDLLAAKCMKKMKAKGKPIFSDFRILRTFAGRPALFRDYPKFDYMGTLARAITPPGKKPKVIIPIRKRPLRKPRRVVPVRRKRLGKRMVA